MHRLREHSCQSEHSCLRRSPKERRRRTRRWLHLLVARSRAGLRHQGVWPPGPPPDIALSPIFSPRWENPKGLNSFPENILQAAAIVDVRSRGSKSSSRHLTGEGNHHRRPSSSPCLPLEWCVSSLPWTRWMSSPPCASCLDLVSSYHDQDHRYVILHVVFVGIWWILSTMSSWFVIYHLYVVYDLACSPLLVDILAE
jgi:hypothetical protein